ncbi:hypothetical protein IAD21_03244 [Abditibacteriota bacterium]|nr:hypothetical protein IAD21_03244 [Abditibacteriota bacterium]
MLFPQRTEDVVTSDLTQNSTHRIRQVRTVRWNIEEFHCEINQLTGAKTAVAANPASKATISPVLFLMGTRLKYLAY